MSSSGDIVSTLERFASLDHTALPEQDRARSLAAARRLCQHLETPYELSRRLAWQEPGHTVAIKCAMNLGLFKHLSKVGAAKGNSISSKELAIASHGHEELVSRLCRMLAAWGTIREVDEDRYAPTATSDGLMDPTVNSGITLWFDSTSGAMATWPKYLQEHDYERSGIQAEGNFAKGIGKGLPFFGWMDEHPEALHNFANHMVAFQVGRPTWVDLYPTQERLLDGADAEGVLLVDIGGSFGQDATRLHQKHPQPAGRLVVQDLPTIVEQAANEKINPIIEFQAHDFTTAQPVKGARAYLFHSILHDWLDDIAHTLLTHVAEAMKPCYSKLLIGDHVISARNVSPFSTALDMAVGALLGAKERTEQAWRDLLARAGLKITNIYSVPAANGHSVIEAELA